MNVVVRRVAGAVSASMLAMSVMSAVPAAASTSGYPWVSVTPASASGLNSVTYGNGKFVAVGLNTVMVSADGSAWSSVTPPPVDADWSDVVFGGGKFVAVAAGRVMTSPNGNDWTERTAAATNAWTSITYGNGMFVAVAASGVGNRVMTSNDGVSWTLRASAADLLWDEVAFGAGRFVAAAGSLSPGSQFTMYSSDGITWTRGGHPVITGIGALTFGNGLFVAMGWNSGNVLSSADGITWTTRASGLGTQWFGIAYGDGVFAAVSPNFGNAATGSKDAASWNLRTATAVKEWRSVAYGEGLFVAVASSTSSQMMSTGTFAPQVVTWNPSDVSPVVTESPFTPNPLATNSGTGSISYSVASAGTSGCAVDSTTGLLTFSDAGSCVVTATASAVPEAYSSASESVTFTVSRVPQLVSWAPLNTAVLTTDSPLTPSQGATSSGDGAISYAVTTAGTTGCVVDPVTGVLSFSAAGSCEVLATAAQTQLYAAGSSSATFTVSRPPLAVTSISPTSGGVGTSVTIVGTGFAQVSKVTFGGTSAPFTVLSGASLVTSVPMGAKSGPIVVTTPDGTASSATFSVSRTAKAPRVQSFSPTSGAVGTVVSINGTDLAGATAVRIGTMTVTSGWSVLSATQLSMPVPAGATSGTVAVTTAGGTGTSSGNFTLPGTKMSTSLVYGGSTSARPGAKITLKATLTAGSTPIPSALLTFSLNGVEFTAVTGSTGVASVSTTAPTKSGSYSVGVAYGGSATYEATSVAGSLTVK